MVVERRAVAPDFVAAHFNQARAQHDAHHQPPKQHDDGQGRSHPRKRPQIKQRTQKNGQKPRLGELNFPAIAVPLLPHVHKREVEHPERRQQHPIGKAGHHHARKHQPRPGRGQQGGIRMPEPKQRRQPRQPRARRPERAAHLLQVVADGQQAFRANQGHYLVDGHQKRDGIERAQQPQNDKPRQPVAGRADGLLGNGGGFAGGAAAHLLGMNGHRQGQYRLFASAGSWVYTGGFSPGPPAAPGCTYSVLRGWFLLEFRLIGSQKLSL